MILEIADAIVERLSRDHPQYKVDVAATPHYITLTLSQSIGRQSWSVVLGKVYVDEDRLIVSSDTASKSHILEYGDPNVFDRVVEIILTEMPIINEQVAYDDVVAAAYKACRYFMMMWLCLWHRMN